VTKFISGSTETERRLDRFELIAELASGGMATVYLARLSGAGGFQRFVAIKRLHPHLASDEEFVQMFLDEARLAARLHHPNVVPILEIGESPQGYYLVMEYVEGDTLARILARSAQAGRMLSPKVSLRICLDTIAGLHVAHELKDDDEQPLHIVHRDVSPQNILIGMDGSARITDFGVARATTRLSTTRTGQLKGKLAYMAPEQAKGSDVDRRADVFAMGIVVWECLTQKRLFKGEGEADTLNRVLYEPIPSCKQTNPEVGAPLEAVVMKALERDRDKRYANASDFGDALEKAARDAGWLGNHKDVASHLEGVLGTDISAQRDAVRAWLARSEPSQRMDFALPRPSAAAMAAETKVGEAAPGVSSVSSAVIQLPGTNPPQYAPVPMGAMELPPRKRSRAWMAFAAVGVVIGVGGLFAVSSMRKTAPPVTATAPPPKQETTGTAPVLATQASATVEPTAPASVAETTHVPTNNTTTHATTKTGGRGYVKPGVTATTAATAQATATVPPAGTIDDISKNPYR
jgi:hypothetical protein